MGITIIEKSTPRTRKIAPKLALVLAGGGMPSSAFRLGGLAAIDDALRERKLAEFDLYLGLSTGALLAAPLAMGLSPRELLASFDGIGDEAALSTMDLYAPNVDEILWRPIEFLADLTTWFPRAVGEVLTHHADLRRALERSLPGFFRAPSLRRGRAVAGALLRALRIERPFPFFLDYVPSGLFDNRRLESFLREFFSERGLANDFRNLFRERGKELYIVATRLDTAERVVFGHDEDGFLTISEAVQATTALPGLYRPARIRGTDYIDGSVRRTANIDVAIDHGADLVIVFNPFRPFNNLVRPDHGGRRTRGAPLADHGLVAVLGQVFRSLLHSRLHLGLNQYRDDQSFRGDIVLIEPSDTDESFFQSLPANLLVRRQAAADGHASVRRSLEAHRARLASIFERYGLSMVPGRATDEELPTGPPRATMTL